jgi:hypothetical protein
MFHSTTKICNKWNLICDVQMSVTGPQCLHIK